MCRGTRSRLDASNCIFCKHGKTRHVYTVCSLCASVKGLMVGDDLTERSAIVVAIFHCIRQCNVNSCEEIIDGCREKIDGNMYR